MIGVVEFEWGSEEKLVQGGQVCLIRLSNGDWVSWDFSSNIIWRNAWQAQVHRRSNWPYQGWLTCLRDGWVWLAWSNLSGGVRNVAATTQRLLLFPLAAQWRYNIATLAWKFQAKVDGNWYLIFKYNELRWLVSFANRGGWQQRCGHSHSWRRIFSIIMIVANIIMFWWQRWHSVNCRL